MARQVRHQPTKGLDNRLAEPKLRKSGFYSTRHGIYHTRPLALIPESNFVRTTLPAMCSWNPDGMVEVCMQFVGEEGAVDLGVHQLFVVSAWQESFVVGVSTPWANPLPQANRLAHSVRIDRFTKPVEAKRIPLSTLKRVAPSSMPSHPLAYCGYDVFVLFADGFRFLDKAQLDALAKWVRAGGSLCVATTGVATRSLEQGCAGFLNDLVGESQGSPFFLDPQGQLASQLDTANGGIGMHHVDLGRLVVATRALDEAELKASRWARAVTHLWKVKAGQIPTLLAEQWEPAPPDITVALGGLSQLTKTLMPETVRMMPLSTAATILVLFILTVGPVDYFLLGLIRRRRWTWVVFPAVTIAFSYATIRLSNQYMGHSDHRTGAVVVDIGPGGRVLRQTRFELIFGARPRQVVAQKRGHCLRRSI